MGNAEAPWPRTPEEIASEVERLVAWRRAVHDGSAVTRVLQEDFGLGLSAAMRWCLGATTERPMDGVPAEVTIAEFNLQVARALVFADEQGEHWQFGFGVLCWLQWLAGHWPEIPYPALP